MTVALMLVTHDRAGQQLLDTAQITLAQTLPAVGCMAVAPDDDPQQRVAEGRRLCKKLNQGDGVLVLSDLYGSTPGNISRQMCAENVQVVFGLNLPMLIRTINYRHLPLNELAGKAIAGGIAGIRLCLRVRSGADDGN